MTSSSMTRWGVVLALFVACLGLLPLQALAQQKEEEPFWAIGRPKAGPGAQLAPVPPFPIPTPADKLPLSKIRVPAGFKVEVWVPEILDARMMRLGDNGTLCAKTGPATWSSMSSRSAVVVVTASGAGNFAMAKANVRSGSSTMPVPMAITAKPSQIQLTSGLIVISTLADLSFTWKLGMFR